jgi:DNA ligase (NAD+)
MQLQQQTQTYLQKSVTDLLTDPQIHINILISLIHYHNTQYYLYTSPVISDSQYDHLFDLLKWLETQFPIYIQQNSPTQRLIGQQERFASAPHSIPLLSLQNTYTSEDIINRWKTLDNTISQRSDSTYTMQYCIEPKLDGNAVELIYINWSFHQAITRWDGQYGEDISEHAKYLLNLPLQLIGNNIPQKLQLRGEIIMSKQAHTKLNEYQTQEGLPLFANPRNAVAGTLRNLNPKITQDRGLSCIVYDLLAMEWALNISHHTRIINQIGQRWLPTIKELMIAHTLDEIIDFCKDEKVIKHLEQQRYETDGLVIKINDLW